MSKNNNSNVLLFTYIKMCFQNSVSLYLINIKQKPCCIPSLCFGCDLRKKCKVGFAIWCVWTHRRSILTAVSSLSFNVLYSFWTSGSLTSCPSKRLIFLCFHPHICVLFILHQTRLRFNDHISVFGKSYQIPRNCEEVFMILSFKK